MADQQRPSDRIIGSVNEHTTNTTNGGVRDLRNLMQGVDPFKSGPRNPDGTLDEHVAKKNADPNKPTSQQKNQQKQQISVFQLLTKTAAEILNKLTTLLQRQDQQKKQREQQNKKFLEQIQKSVSPTLFNDVTKKQVLDFFADINSISKSLTGVFKTSQDDLTKSLTTLNTTLSDKFIPQFKNIDITSAINSALKGQFNVAQAMSAKIVGDNVDVASIICGKIVGSYNISSAFDNRIDGIFNVSDAISKQITGEFDVTTGFNNFIKGQFNVGKALENKVTGSLNISTILPPEEIKSQFTNIFDTINLSIIDTFDASGISKSLQGKIDQIELKTNNKEIEQVGGILTTPIASKTGETEGGGTLPPLSTPPSAKAEPDSQKNNQPKANPKIEKVSETAEEFKKKIDFALTGLFNQYFKKEYQQTLPYIPIIAEADDTFFTKVLNLAEKLGQQLSGITKKLQNIDSDLVSIYDEKSDTNKEVSDNLAKINKSIVGNEQEVFRATIPNEQGTEAKEVEVNINDVSTLRGTAREIAETNVNELAQQAKVFSERKDQNAPKPQQVKALSDKINAFGESIMKNMDTSAKILGQKSEFDGQRQFGRLAETLKNQFKIDFKSSTPPTKETISKFIYNRSLSKEQMVELAKLLNGFNRIDAFDTKRNKRDVVFRDTDSEAIMRRRLQLSMLDILNGVQKSKNPLINQNLNAQDKLKFWTTKSAGAEKNQAAANKVVSQVVNKPENFNLRNFLTNFGAYNSLDQMLGMGVGNKLNKISKKLGSIDEKSGFGFGGGEGGKGIDASSLGDIIGKASGGKFNMKGFKDIISSLGKNKIGKEVTKKMGGSVAKKALGIGTKAAGVGGLTAGGIAAGAGIAAGVAAAVGIAATAGYGAYKAKEWDRQIGNTEGKSATPKALGGTYTDGALANLNHYLGEGLIARAKTFWKTRDVRKLWGHDNQLDNQYTAAEHKALISLGKQKADQLKQERQQGIAKSWLNEYRKGDFFAEQMSRLNVISDSFLNKINESTGTQNLHLSSALESSKLSREQIAQIADSSTKFNKVAEYQHKLNDRSAAMLGTSRGIQRIVSIASKGKSKPSDLALKEMNSWILSNKLKDKDLEKMPPAVLLQRKITRADLGLDGGKKLSDMTDEELEYWLNMLNDQKKRILTNDSEYADAIADMLTRNDSRGTGMNYTKDKDHSDVKSNIDWFSKNFIFPIGMDLIDKINQEISLRNNDAMGRRVQSRADAELYMRDKEIGTPPLIRQSTETTQASVGESVRTGTVFETFTSPTSRFKYGTSLLDTLLQNNSSTSSKPTVFHLSTTYNIPEEGSHGTYPLNPGQ